MTLAPQEATPGGRAPLGIRAFVAAYLAAFVLCAVAIVEFWPFTGWLLFSHLRHPVRVSWEVDTVDSASRETAIASSQLPPGFTHLQVVMRDFHLLTPVRQEGICRALAAEVRRHGGQVTGVRVYRRFTDVRRHQGRRRQPPPRRRLTYTCADGRGARAAS